MEKTYNYLRVYNDIKGKILSGEYPDQSKLSSEAELQDVYGVSRITVKKAMELLEKDGLIDRYPGKGTFVRLHRLPAASPAAANQSSRIISVVMSGFGSNFGQNFLAGVSEEANRKGCCLMTGLCFSSLEEETQIMERQIANGAQGIIIMPLHSEKGINTGIVTGAMQGYPLVLADRYLEGIPLPYVGSDHAGAAFQATQYLFELGHKNIGLISSAPTTTAIIERESGYMKAYAMTKYRVHPACLVPDIKSSMPGRHSTEDIRQDIDRMKCYFKDNPNVTALLCIDYNVMKICETAARESDMRIPEDISLVCFDAPDDGFAQFEYTHIRQQEREIGTKAVQMLLDVINGNHDPDHILIPTELCIGMSTGKPKH